MQIRILIFIWCGSAYLQNSYCGTLVRSTTGVHYMFLFVTGKTLHSPSPSKHRVASTSAARPLSSAATPTAASQPTTDVTVRWGGWMIDCCPFLWTFFWWLRMWRFLFWLGRLSGRDWRVRLPCRLWGWFQSLSRWDLPCFRSVIVSLGPDPRIRNPKLWIRIRDQAESWSYFDTFVAIEKYVVNVLKHWTRSSRLINYVPIWIRWIRIQNTADMISKLESPVVTSKLISTGLVTS